MVLWIFGYASLLWTPGFAYDHRIVGFIKGYRRAFNLACFEHRGTLDLPARVATLERDEDAVCWGVALRVKDTEASRAMEYLRVRESEYDLLEPIEFFTEESPSKPAIPDVLVFMSTTDRVKNKYYLGAAPREDIARQIAMATGPCGPNCDYLFRLVEALRDIGHEDAEVVELANAVRKILSELKIHGGVNGFPSLLPQLSTVVPISGFGHVALNHMPRSPRLLKSQAL